MSRMRLPPLPTVNFSITDSITSFTAWLSWGHDCQFVFLRCTLSHVASLLKTLPGTGVLTECEIGSPTHSCSFPCFWNWSWFSFPSSTYNLSLQFEKLAVNDDLRLCMDWHLASPTSPFVFWMLPLQHSLHSWWDPCPTSFTCHTAAHSSRCGSIDVDLSPRVGGQDNHDTLETSMKMMLALPGSLLSSELCSHH